MSGSSDDKAALRALTRRLDPEPEHAFQVRRNALQLFDATAELHGLDAAARDLLEAAALLHDIGHTRGMARHHKHSRDIILEHDLPGFDADARAMIAAVARYHRKAHPRPGHRVYGDLAPEQQRVVDRLAAILRIADGLDRGHDAAVRRITAARAGDTLRITAEMRADSPIDIHGALRKRDLFESIHGVDVEIVGAVAGR